MVLNTRKSDVETFIEMYATNKHIFAQGKRDEVIALLGQIDNMGQNAMKKLLLGAVLRNGAPEDMAKKLAHLLWLGAKVRSSGRLEFWKKEQLRFQNRRR